MRRPGIAAFSVSLLGIGRVLGDVPAAWIADRFGDRRSMIGAAILAFFCFFICIIANSLLVLDLNLIVLGMTSATFYLARQAYLLDVVPSPMRARAQSTLAGSHRIGLFIGPFLGAAAISLTDVRGAYVVAMASAAGAAVVLFLVPDAEVNGVQAIKTRGPRGTRSGPCGPTYGCSLRSVLPWPRSALSGRPARSCCRCGLSTSG